jgi:hypothetical protein
MKLYGQDLNQKAYSFWPGLLTYLGQYHTGFTETGICTVLNLKLFSIRNGGMYASAFPNGTAPHTLTTSLMAPATKPEMLLQTSKPPPTHGTLLE